MARLRDYFWTAFNARLLGMPVPPNWLGLAGVGVLGLVNPGFWLLGVGLEAGYLLACVTSARFRAVVDARERLRGSEGAQGKVQRILAGEAQILDGFVQHPFEPKFCRFLRTQ